MFGGVRGNEPVMFIHGCRRRLAAIVAGVRHALRTRLWTRPAAVTHATGTGADLLRSRAQVLAENAFLRQQLLVQRHSVPRPALTRADRALLVLLAGRVRAWRRALLIIQPATLLRWHRAGFRALWRRQSRPGPPAPPGGDRRPDPTPGGREPALGHRADSGRTGEARHPRGQAHHPGVPARPSRAAATRAGLGDLPTRPRCGHLGLRLLAGDGPPLPPAVRVRRRRARLAPRGPCRGGAAADRRLGRAAAA
jgi:hypothetical protein